MTRIAAAVASLVLISTPSWADVIYSYTGNEFDTFYGVAACPPICHFSGYFTLADALPANSSTTNLIPLDFSFTDGFATVNSANAIPGTFFWIITGPGGGITGWNNNYYSSTNVMYSGTNPPGCVGCHVTDEGGDLVPTYYAQVLNDPGVWTETASAVPEPSTLLLLGGGLLAAGRRLRPRPK